MPAIFSIIGLALNLMGVIVLFRYGMPCRARTDADTGWWPDLRISMNADSESD